MILDATGKPFTIEDVTETRAASGGTTPPGLSVNSFLLGLNLSRADSNFRARAPFRNHPTVYAAAMAIAKTLTSAPYTFFRDTEQELEIRRSVARKTQHWQGNIGRMRNRLSLHQRKRGRIYNRALEYDANNPLNELILKPNPFQDSTAFFQMIAVWMSIRGECMVVALDGEEWIFPGEVPTSMWPMSPELFEPEIDQSERTPKLIGWWFRTPPWMNATSQRTLIPASAVYHFKYPDPENPVRGMSPLTPAAIGIETDMLITAYNRAVLENGGDPGGILTYDSHMGRKEQEEFMSKWNEISGGAANARRTRLLTDGMKYNNVALSPKEMEYKEQRKTDQDDILGTMGVPPSQIGITEFTNYATALGQKKDFWDNTVIPLGTLIETQLDATLLFGLPDSIVGMFDTSNVEALRSGLVDKTNIATQLSSDKLHMPPDVAYEIVGIESPEYVANNTAIVNGLIASSVEDALKRSKATADKAINPGNIPGEPETPGIDPNNPFALPVPTLSHGSVGGNGKRTGNEDKSAPAVHTRKSGAQSWNDFVTKETEDEQLFGKRYRKWVRAEGKDTLARYDANAKEVERTIRAYQRQASVDLTFVLPEVQTSSNKLTKEVRPVYSKALADSYALTVEDIGGIPVFEIDDPAIIEEFIKRETLFTSLTPRTLVRNLERSLVAGMQAGETVQQLRDRIKQVYGVAGSDAKTLQVARTETANFMNSTRDTMFDLQGIGQTEWITAGDEIVRESHQIYGSVGPVERETNYLEFTGKESEGTLAYPGDSRAPADEVINCRCLSVPA